MNGNRTIEMRLMFQIFLALVFLQIRPCTANKETTTRLIHHFRAFMGNSLYAAINISADIAHLFPMYPIVDGPYPDDYFDFIVVGAGPSGCVIANRLSANPNIKVLLLEAGEEPSWFIEQPGLALAVPVSKYSWSYKPENQKGYCTGCINGRPQWYHGRGLGGSTLINLMMYVRGNKEDFNHWERLGNKGWGYKDVLPLFKRMEHVHVRVHDPEFRGHDGLLSVSDPAFASKASHAFVQAAQEAGYPYLDYNGKSQIGVSFLQSTTLKGRRFHAERAYLRPFRHRKNLVIRKNSLVTKVLIDPETKTAYGVEYESLGKKYKLTCKKEVILSSGVFNSPKLLMLSGVGPKEDLERFDIPVIKNLPVGKLLYDHLFFPNLFFTLNKPITLTALPFTQIETYVEHQTYGGGPPGFCLTEAVAYLNTNVSNTSMPNTDVADIELMISGGSPITDFGWFTRRYLNIPQDLYDAVWQPYETTPVLLVVPVLLHPKSKGHMTLLSKDPAESPLFFPNYFSDPENHDIKTLIASIREVQRIVRSPALQKYEAKIGDRPIPGCEQYGFDTDEYWECALRTIMSSIYHEIATCKMGPHTDPEAVVSPRLKVYGIKRLRVADVSIMPSSVSGHPMAGAYMIGEKASDLIKEEWGI